MKSRTVWCVGLVSGAGPCERAGEELPERILIYISICIHVYIYR